MVDGVLQRPDRPHERVIAGEAVVLAQHETQHTDPALAARDRAISELLYGSGLRVGELLGLDLNASADAAGWVDLPDATAHVLGKGRKRRSVPVGAAALQALRDWLVVRPQLAAICCHRSLNAPQTRCRDRPSRGTRLRMPASISAVAAQVSNAAGSAVRNRSRSRAQTSRTTETKAALQRRLAA